MDKFEIELTNITKRFGNVTAVNNISFGIRSGEFFSLLGPSGCGKTTTLRMIAGLEDPTLGRILLSGKDVTNVPPHRRNVNTVFQDYAIFPHMNVYENIYFPLRMRRIPRKVAAPRIKKILETVNMSRFENRYSGQLSGGQRQRIALARALVNEPKALLLDEPLGALDFKLRVAMQIALKDIQREFGITFIYVTHDQLEAITMSDRIAVMNDGIIDQIGTPDKIYNKPKTAFVASFIGEMNFLEGKLIRKKDDTLVVKIADFEVICERGENDFLEGEDMLVCVRPERISINSHIKSGNEIIAKLKRAIFRGSKFEITVTFNNNIELVSTVEDKGWNKSFNLGENLKLGWEKEDTIVFPMDMKNRIIRYK